MIGSKLDWQKKQDKYLYERNENSCSQFLLVFEQELDVTGSEAGNHKNYKKMEENVNIEENVEVNCDLFLKVNCDLFVKVNCDLFVKVNCDLFVKETEW